MKIALGIVREDPDAWVGLNKVVGTNVLWNLGPLEKKEEIPWVVSAGLLASFLPL